MTALGFRTAARVSALPPNFWGGMDRDIARLSAKPGTAMTDVSKGNPAVATPEHIVAAMQREHADPVNPRYLASPGCASLRPTIAPRYRSDLGDECDTHGRPSRRKE